MLATFPEFTKLTFENREDYERMVRDYPPFSDISFVTLQIWWNLENQLSVAELNGNLVIHYYLPFDPENSGYSLIGKDKLEESANTIFAYLREQHEPVKLVHVPEFVVSQMDHGRNIQFEEEIDYNEYILDSRALASLEDAAHGRTRRKVNRFKREVGERNVEIRELDLSSEEVQNELFEAVIAWEQVHSSENDPDHTEHQAIKKTLTHAKHLDIRHIGLYVDDKLHAVVLYHRPEGSDHFIIHHLKVDYSIPYIFDYMTHHIADKAAKEDVNFLNMEMDLGIERLRQHKMGLRPVDFFRKYTVSPATD